jgi:hypothetical protein
MTVQQIKAMRQNKASDAEQLTSFTATRMVGNFLHVDEPNEKWLVPDGLFGKVKNPRIFDYSDIMDYELLEDGTSVASGGVGRAIVGGALLGGVGAIVGGVTGKKKSKNICDTLKIKITINDVSNPTQYINFITSPMKKDGILYKTLYQNAQECASILQIICDGQSKKQPIPTDQQPQSTAEEIMKFKQLLDVGAITQDEYDEKKKQLLGV